MHVYLIRNILSNKAYVGKDCSLNHRRWYYHKWAYNKPHVHDYNKTLYRAFRKYGLENFEYSVLENVISSAELLKRERYWIAYYNSDNPRFGYNRAGAVSGYAEGRNRYFIKDPSGAVTETVNLPHFASQHGLHVKSLYEVAAGRKKSHRGWRCSKHKEQLAGDLNRKSSPRKGIRHTKKRIRHSKTEHWNLISPTCEQFTICNLKQYCSQVGWSYRSVLRSVSEKKTYKLWRIEKKIIPYEDTI